MNFLPVFACACLGLAIPGLHTALGQTSAPEWPTGSFDQQRDAWQRNETSLSAENARNIKLLWKLKTNNKTMGMQSFREPLIVAGVSGNKTVAILAGSSNDVYVIDVASGAFLWQKQLKWASDKPQEAGEGRGFICTNALTATPVVTPAGQAPHRQFRAGHQLAMAHYPGHLSAGLEPHAAAISQRLALRDRLLQFPVRTGMGAEDCRRNELGRRVRGAPRRAHTTSPNQARQPCAALGGKFGAYPS